MSPQQQILSALSNCLTQDYRHLNTSTVKNNNRSVLNSIVQLYNKIKDPEAVKAEKVKLLEVEEYKRKNPGKRGRRPGPPKIEAIVTPEEKEAKALEHQKQLLIRKYERITGQIT